MRALHAPGCMCLCKKCPLLQHISAMTTPVKKAPKYGNDDAGKSQRQCVFLCPECQCQGNEHVKLHFYAQRPCRAIDGAGVWLKPVVDKQQVRGEVFKSYF